METLVVIKYNILKKKQINVKDIVNIRILINNNVL